jgi:heptaprenyl diphosphate synthase
VKRSSHRSVARTGMLAGLALILFVVEAQVPRPLPWMKLGLGNIAVVLALLLYGGSAATAIAVVKILVGGLLAGSLGTPTFVIGGGAGLASVAAMILVRSTTGGMFSPVGISIVGAITHQTSQLGLAYIYVGTPGIFSLLPLFLLSGLISGFLIGLLVAWALSKLRATGWSA